jgi:hypothetical protein
MREGEDHGSDLDGVEPGGHEPVGEEVGLEREGRAWSGGRGFDDAGYGYGAYAASDDD